MQLSVAQLLVAVAAIPGLLGATCGDAATPAIGAAEARQLVTAVMKPFRHAVGAYVISTFDALPRQASQVRPNAPIQIVVGDSRGAPVPGVYSNCIADSLTRSIRCDLRLVDDLIDDFALAQSENERDIVRRELLGLILAHEIGHIMNRDRSASYHGDQNGFSILRYASYQVELKADAFAVRLIDRYVKDRDLEYGMVVALANNALKKSLCPDTFPAMCACPGYTDPTMCSRLPLGPGLLIANDDNVNVTLAGTHPEYVVRFVRLVYLSRGPQAQRFYGPEARRIMLKIVVRDEQGQLESTAALFM